MYYCVLRKVLPVNSTTRRWWCRPPVRIKTDPVRAIWKNGSTAVTNLAPPGVVWPDDELGAVGVQHVMIEIRYLS